MATENTHLFFAHEITTLCKNSHIRDLIAKNPMCYYVGSIFPDCFLYSPFKSVRKISFNVHRDIEYASDLFIFNIIDQSKENISDSDLSFMFGYLTHFALDSILHPIIQFYSDFDWEESKIHSHNEYLYWHYETLIDISLNQFFFFDNFILPRSIHELFITKLIAINRSQIIHALRVQKLFFKIFRNNTIYQFLRLLSKTGMITKKYLAVFYKNSKYEKQQLPTVIRYIHPVTKEHTTTTLKNLLIEASRYCINLFETVHAYSTGSIDKVTCIARMQKFNNIPPPKTRSIVHNL